MNTLNRTILKGEEVIIKQELMNEENQDLERRVFVAEHGFGMTSFTSGAAIIGHYKYDGEPARIEGSDLSPEETLQWQQDHPLIDPLIY